MGKTTTLLETVRSLMGTDIPTVDKSVIIFLSRWPAPHRDTSFIKLEAGYFGLLPVFGPPGWRIFRV